jgi:hypothetical protein
MEEHPVVVFVHEVPLLGAGFCFRARRITLEKDATR